MDTMSGGNGRVPVEVFDARLPQLIEAPRPPAQRRRPLWPALVLFILTVLSTLSVGSEFARSYAEARAPFTGDQDVFAMMFEPIQNPQLLLLGIPFSFTLLAILGTHELGHYVACRLYGIDASFPYFIPAPTLFGTFGAFIRIRSPITTRRALFDVGLSGPIVGFLVAVPAMAFAIATSKILPGAQAGADIVFGNPLLMRGLMAVFHPGVDSSWLLLHPVGRAAWMGLFATGLNLLPMWQLDGGHIVYSLASRYHRRISLGLSAVLMLLGRFTWQGWYGWGGMLFVLSLWFRHPPLLDRWEPLGPSRRFWAVIGLIILILCLTPFPVTTPQH